MLPTVIDSHWSVSKQNEIEPPIFLVVRDGFVKKKKMKERNESVNWSQIREHPILVEGKT